MNAFRSARKLFFLVALVALLLFTIGASASSSSEAVVTLSAGQAEFSAAEDVVVQVTISNPTNHTIRVLKWFTPLDDVEEPLFKVARDGQPVQYLGAIYKRPAPTGADYVSLKAGESLSASVSLAQYYDLSQSGSYSVAFDVKAANLSSEKSEGRGQPVETLTSAPIELKIEGRASGPVDALAPLAVTGSTTFNKCTTTQQTQLVSARSQAGVYSADALAYLNANKTGARYTTWFGVVSSARYSTAKNHFSSISSAMDTAAVKFDCGCKKKYYAYVYPNQPYNIYVCAVFWQAPLTGTDSKAGTLIHEMSHFTIVSSTDDYVYGQTNAKSLAISSPDDAVFNADNHEYFAENTPALP
ncbi:MAG: M35 family metallo-endopeptidase [Chloroflexota bacterium]